MVEYTHNLDYIYKSLADPTRRDILRRVCERQQTISELAENYQMSFAGVAKHLTVLEKAQLVTKNKQGKEQLIEARPESFLFAAQHLDSYKQKLQHRYDALEKLLQEG